MGNTYANIALSRTTHARAVAAATQMNREAYVVSLSKGLTYVLDRESECDPSVQGQLASSLTRTLGCGALSAMNYDDDLLILTVYRRGHSVGSYAWEAVQGLVSKKARMTSPRRFVHALAAAFATPAVCPVLMARIAQIQSAPPSIRGAVRRRSEVSAHAIGVMAHVAIVGCVMPQSSVLLQGFSLTLSDPKALPENAQVTHCRQQKRTRCYTQIVVRGPDRETISNALRTMKRVAYVSETFAGRTTILDRDSELESAECFEDLCRGLSRKLRCSVLGSINDEGYLLLMSLCVRGELISRCVLRAQGYHGDITLPSNGWRDFVEHFGKAFPGAITNKLQLQEDFADAEASTRQPKELWSPIPFVELVHANLASYMGIYDPFGSCYGYRMLKETPTHMSLEGHACSYVHINGSSAEQSGGRTDKHPNYNR